MPLLNQHIEARDLLLTYRDVALRRYYVGRIVLIGDAAHSMSPQLGQGASMALQDSCALADALEQNDDIATALWGFDRQRRSEVCAYQRISRWTTPLFQSESRVLAMVRDRSLYPLSRMPFLHRSMLRMLSGQRRIFFDTPV
jgi:2-polyprenyl-6-methoxyphenol hydroxylase-like FAD-dependent oxidoreductase